MPIPRHALLLLTLLVPAPLQAQQPAHDARAHGVARDSVAGMGTLLVTRVAPALDGRARTEAMLTQPMLSLRGAHVGRALQYAVMLNAELWTMPDGEPVAGIWGEGFIDRRHPHTLLHEVMITGERRVGSARLSLSAGKGVVPFGTDDPMVRPFTKYPANHHFSQVLERLQLTAALRLTPRIGVELATFNGDEPAGTTAPPRWRRFGDSRAARLTLWPVPQLELQGSGAFVRSPEFASGDGLDQRKLSASARWTPASGVLRYLLVEWARTEEVYAARRIVDYGTLLGEARATRGPWSAAIRLEQTSRPEEERLLDPFRTARPPGELTILGVTRWRLASGQLAAALPARRGVHALAFGEATYARSSPVLRPVLLDPANISGASTAWHFTLGLRLGLGAMPSRVGRYGAAAGGAATAVSLTMPPH
ncbi:MAG: hypothetical protein V4813_09120 [Gemmatimonadota bacterium]